MAPEKRTSDESPTTPAPKRIRKQTQFLSPDSLIGEPLDSREDQNSVKIFQMANLEKHENWIGNIKDYNWKPRTSAFYDLVNSQGKIVTVILFGKVLGARVGLYGDFNEIYHQSLTSPGIRNLVWKLGPPPAYADSFFNQFHGLQKIENLLDKDLEPSQKAAKAASDIELKRKIAKKVDSTNPIIPIDSERDFWKKAKDARFCLNSLPGGVMDGCKRPVPFEEWDSFFASNPNVLVNAVVRATSYKGKKFVQVVPTSILEINLEAIADNENDLDFFEI